MMGHTIDRAKPLALEEYLRLPYAIEIVPNNGKFFARVEELPGCMAWSDNKEELLSLIEGAKRAWIKDALEQGDVVPEPLSEEDFSGNVLVRMPKTIHRNLRREAEREGVSLNQLISTTLAARVGF
jgi:antitoxin HicB